jgi:HAD superfamily 5'-nucleotidase-like hydrolase
MDLIPRERQLFCNRTLNLRAIRAVGYDMDYTLIHYHVEEWERRAYHYIKMALEPEGWPVKNLEFDPTIIQRGLVVDTETGNLLKANRFGFVKRGLHGTKPLGFEEQRKMYSRTLIDLSEKRWLFLNTLFSLSEGCIYAQLVDLLDQGLLPRELNYSSLFWKVRAIVDFAHMEGKLKAEIISDPARFIALEPEMPLALLDQKQSGKKLLLITNSEWFYTVPVMTYAFDRFLPKGMKWQDLFDTIVVGARKPAFFTTDSPFFEIVNESGLMKPNVGNMKNGTAYLGGSARQLEKHLGLSGDEILYVGDHMYGDVHVTKNVLRWRTALILRELENDIVASHAFKKKQDELNALMSEKEMKEAEYSNLRLALQRSRLLYGPSQLKTSGKPAEHLAAHQEKMTELKSELEGLDKKITPLAKLSSELSNKHWGPLMRAGNDKSYLAFQMERYADVYASRVSNFLYATPFVYLRSSRGSMPHDPA